MSDTLLWAQCKDRIMYTTAQKFYAVIWAIHGVIS